MRGVREFDTYGAWLLERLTRQWRGIGGQASVVGMPEHDRTLLKEMSGVNLEPVAPPARPNPIVSALAAVGRGMTGFGRDLGMAIRCQSDNYKIEIRSKLSYSGGRLSGNWEERTFNASGTASGTASPSKISLAIKGAVSANMLVNYTKTTQNVNISVSGVALQGVRISLSRS